MVKMLQTAVLVDAGYAYAQGSVTLGFPKTERRKLRLNPSAIKDALRELTLAIEPSGRLLRVYWYDGLAKATAMNADQNAIWATEGIKCRFGTINREGQQKGVDSLIVTDLIELARIQAISDAIVVSGDEDVRVGVQVAQSFGVRVHLLGLHPARGSQSSELIAEADTHHEWGADCVSTWLSVLNDETPLDSADLALEIHDTDWLQWVTNERATSISPEQANEILDFAKANRDQIPPDFDRPTLALARKVLGRDLDHHEKRNLRIALRVSLANRAVG